MGLELESRRGVYIDITNELPDGGGPLSAEELAAFTKYDEIYRCACALLYNYVPMSGHPGGSVSSGRFVAAIVFDAMAYDLSDPDRRDADMISYAAGHKALGLYTMWALRNEIARAGASELLAPGVRDQLRLEDLLGFRRNPVTATPLFEKHRVKPLDGHPTPATPFVRLATGASGVGVASSLGLALGAADFFGDAAPTLHIVEGEGGMTPGRVGEAMAAAGTMSLGNVVMHIDWNQASIDSNAVCRDGDTPGDYVQWTPMEFAYLHDWNVIYVPDGTDFQQIVTAQRKAASLNTGQPTAIVYRTTKGWKYGIEGRASHGAGHKLCSSSFYEILQPLSGDVGIELPTCDAQATSCSDGKNADVLEDCFWGALCIVREAVEKNKKMVDVLADRLKSGKAKLDKLARRPHETAPKLDRLFDAVEESADRTPKELRLKPGSKTTLRAELGNVLNHLNRVSGGAVLAAAADLLDSTSISKTGAGFGEGYYNCKTNRDSRLLSIGGICEDAMCGMLSGLSTFGQHIGAGASYAAFIAPLGHIASRLHAIGQQARHEATGERYSPYVMVCGHVGLKTGEDGPTHADPQALQLLQDNFPGGTMMTLTPWDPQELWPLMAAALSRRPAIIAPFVTRPAETVLDRKSLGLAPCTDAAAGVYALRRARGGGDGVVVLQGSGVAYAFIEGALPLLEREGVDLTVYYVAGAELFDSLPTARREKIFPEAHARMAMGITGFTLPTMHRWITSPQGREATLHPFMKSHFLGSGQANRVLEQAGLDGAAQFSAIMTFLESRSSATVNA